VQILLTTGLSTLSFFSNGYRNWIQSNAWMMWVSLFGAIGFSTSNPTMSTVLPLTIPQCF
jgi:hypothetical protein